MKNEKFNQAVDEIVGFITEVHKLQMDQLKCNIRAVHEANVSEIDPNEIAQQILDIPIRGPLSREIQFKCEGCTDCKGDHKFISKDPYVTIYSIGDLSDLSYVKVGSDKRYGKEFYHHCPEANGKLIRLIQYDAPIMHQCPICGQKYEQK